MDQKSVSFFLDSELFDLLERYRYEGKFSTRSAAIKHILASALKPESGAARETPRRKPRKKTRQ